MFVTDTHPLIYYASQNYKRLSRKALKTFQNTADGKELIYIPAAVLWEISLILKKNPEELKLACTFYELLERLFAIRTFIEEPISREIIAKSHDLTFHSDPFDTLIVATALAKEMALITNDSVIHREEPCALHWD